MNSNIVEGNNNKPNNQPNNQPNNNKPNNNKPNNNKLNNKPNNNKPNNKVNKNRLNFTNTNKRDQEKKEIFEKLKIINDNIATGMNVNPRDIVILTLKLFVIITDEQSDIVKRQKQTDEILLKYGEILKDYDNKSFRLDKLEQIMAAISQLKSTSESDSTPSLR